MAKEKVVLAFSGGLDTSFCVKYLKEDLGMEVHTVLVDTGGFTDEEIKETQKKAMDLGADSHQTIYQTSEYYQSVIRFLLYGNILKNNTYPLSVSAERICQAMAIAHYGNELEADYLAHGSTGAGNDQVRFDLMFSVIAPEIKILTPIRDLKLSRQEEIDRLKAWGIDLNWEKAKYSINKGLWGTSVGGAETLTSHQPLPGEAYPSQLEKSGNEEVSIEFRKGEVFCVNGREAGPVELIREINDLASAYAIGRGVHVGDTIIGIKGRVGFEAPAPLILIKAHEALEKHTLTKWQIHWKEQMANWYGMMLHEGQYLEPVMRNIEEFMESTQEFVSGKVFVKLESYAFHILGIESENDLMNSKFGDYGEMNNAWSGEDVKGFTKIIANQTKIFHAIHK